MIHPKLRLAAARFTLNVAKVADLVDASHAGLDDAIYADGLAVVASSPDMSYSEAASHFSAALAELGHTFHSQDNALRYLRLSYFGSIAEGVVSPADGLGRYHAEVHRAFDDNQARDLGLWDDGSTRAVVDHWDPSEFRPGLPYEQWREPLPGTEMVYWEQDVTKYAREWCVEYAQHHMQPAWRSPTVLALASAIRAERAFDRLPILADALEEAGCDHPDLLAHCRGNSPHTGYCWLVEAVPNPA